MCNIILSSAIFDPDIYILNCKYIFNIVNYFFSFYVFKGIANTLFLKDYLEQIYTE